MSTTSFEFTLNGRSVQVCGVAANTTLLQWLRATGRTGSKEGCAEGDCGACTVALIDLNASGERTYRAINSCITLLPMVAGRELTTVEGLAEGDRLHPVQQAMVDGYGSQCGYCTPGFVVSMFEAYYRPDITKEDQQARCKIGDQLSGNLCRCTGYRPIRDAMLQALAQRPCRPADLFQLRLQKADAVVPALECFDAVSKGSIESCWTTPGYHTGKYPALAFFTTVPFGPCWLTGLAATVSTRPETVPKR